MSRENQIVEWKESWRDDYLRWICGFANSQGGVLIIGKNDRGLVIGISDAGRLLEELPNKIRDLLGIIVEVNLVDVTGKELLEIRVPAYPNPISYRGRYFLRSGSTLQELKGAALDRFLLGSYGRTWDAVPLPGVKVSDLSAFIIQRIFSACRDAGTPVPQIRLDGNDLWLEFPFSPRYLEMTIIEKSQKTPVKTPEMILKTLKMNPHLTLIEVANIIGKSSSAVERASAKLVKTGRIKYVGPQKGGHWEVLE